MTLHDTSSTVPAVTPTPTATAEAASEARDVKDVLDVLRGVLGRHNPATRLFAAHRRDINIALDAAGITPDTEARSCIDQTLAVAQTYEADGMFAVMPTWDFLLSRVARLAQA